MRLITAKEDCTACGACVQVCPKSAIRLVDDGNGFMYPKVDTSLCVECENCKKVCPTDKTMLFPSKEGVAVAGYCRDEDVLSHSTSGGFLTGIVEKFGGVDVVVFGAQQLSDFSVIIRAVDLGHLDLIRRSKYAWSDTCQTFKECREFLLAGKKVVYTGMPCQIAGLNRFLGRDFDNLLTVEVVCHGPPSDLYWQKERSYLERKVCARVVDFSCREKGRRWSDPVICYRFSNGKKFVEQLKYSDFHRIWMSRIISRPSCTSCRYAFADRVADISLADYWHVNRKSPLFNDNRGTSVAFGNSMRGRSVLALLKESYYLESVDRQVMCKSKNAMHGPIAANPLRDVALNDLKRLDFENFVQKYAPKSVRFYLERFLAKFFGSSKAKAILRRAAL